jgi:hypothetical protein
MPQRSSPWRWIRIAVLLFILATVAQSAWLARSRTAEWTSSLRVVIYPINADGSQVSAAYVGQLRSASFEPIEAFFKGEGARYRLPLRDPVEVKLAPTVASQPPAPPFGGNRLEVVAWSLRLRYWAWWNDTWKGLRPHARLFVAYYDPAARPRLPHSTGLQQGMIGVVNAFARADMDGSNNVVITHELLHTFGATDKYDAAGNRPQFPDGYVEPNAQPLHPQQQAEIMAGRIPVSETRAEIPADMDQVAIGLKTAREIHWVK